MKQEPLQKKGKNVAERVALLVKDTVEECGCTLWDVELEKEGSELTLVISIDKPGGVSLDDCEMVNDAVDPLLDDEDPIEGSYTLEISSAGIERELKKPEHIRAFIGSRVSVKLYAPMDGRKLIEGTLAAFDEENKAVTVREENGDTVISLPKIAQLKNIVEF